MEIDRKTMLKQDCPTARMVWTDNGTSLYHPKCFKTSRYAYVALGYQIAVDVADYDCAGCGKTLLELESVS